MPLTVLVTGASGFIGSHLSRALVDAGHDVRAMTRHPDDYSGAGKPVFGDVFDADSVHAAMDGVDAAYYLVHSLDSDDFEEKDAEAALNFGGAAAEAGLDRIIYLGGLGVDDGELSAHLRSRRQVEQLLAGRRGSRHGAACGGRHRARRHLVGDHPPTRRPSARDDHAALGEDAHPADRAAGRRPLSRRRARPPARRRAGCSRSAARRCCATSTCSNGPRRSRASDCRTSTSRCSPRGCRRGWLALVTDVDLATARNLVDSMTNEVIVRDHSIQSIVPGPTMGYDDAVRLALEQRAAAS